MSFVYIVIILVVVIVAGWEIYRRVVGYNGFMRELEKRDLERLEALEREDEEEKEDPINDEVFN